MPTYRRAWLTGARSANRNETRPDVSDRAAVRAGAVGVAANVVAVARVVSEVAREVAVVDTGIVTSMNRV